MRQRFFKLLKPTAVILAIGFTYYLFHELTGFALFCPFRQFLGLYCPGCGISRMFFHLFRLEFAEAFSSNCVVFCMLPIAAGMALFHACRYVRSGSAKLNKAENAGIVITCVILIVFAVVRNLWRIDILVP